MRKKGTRGRGQEDEGLPQDREETEAERRKMAVYRGTGGEVRRVRMRCLILIGQVDEVSRNGPLIARHQSFDSWTSGVSLRRTWPKKGTDLGGWL